MSDDKSKAGGQDRTRIDANESYELRDWAKKFNCTAEQVRDAVKAVGNKTSDVEMHPKGSRATSNANAQAHAGKTL